MEVEKDVDVTPEQKQIILDLLKKHIPDTEVWAYGSRAKRTAKSYSDLDVMVFATEEQMDHVCELKEALEESDLPFRVDLFIWDKTPERFRKNVREKYIVLQKKL